MISEPHFCSNCGEIHLPAPAHKEVLNKMKVVMLRRAADHVIKTMDNKFMVREISRPEEYSMFHNFQKLRYHGLIAPIRDENGKKLKGQWLITRNGWAFVRGEIELSKFVLVANNHIRERSEKKVSLREVNAQVLEIQTRFEYFDVNNKPIGLRPL